MLLASHFSFLIIIFHLWLCRKKMGKVEWLAIVTFLGLDLFFIIIIFPYPIGVFFSYYIPLLFVLAYVFIVVKTFFIVKNKPFSMKIKLKGWFTLSLCIFSSIILIYQSIVYFSGYSYEETPVELTFPLKNGIYIISEGGNGERSPLMNYHFTFEGFIKAGVNESMKYATDITSINILGSNRNCLVPKILDDYDMFGISIYSPCDGEVVNVQNSFPDNKIGDKNSPYNTGNTIIIKTNNVYVLLGHIKYGSITVKKGDKITQGQVIAEVGNSGLSDFPHLHIQSMKGPNWDSEGLPIIFEGKYPKKNSVFIKAK